MSDDALHEALNRNVELREELALTQKAYDAEVEHYRVRMNELEAENARLRAVVERAHDHVAVDERVLRSLAADDLVALISVLRQDCRDAMVENDQLRATVGRYKAFAESEILDRVSAELGTDLRRQLDVSGNMGGLTPGQRRTIDEAVAYAGHQDEVAMEGARGVTGIPPSAESVDERGAGAANAGALLIEGGATDE